MTETTLHVQQKFLGVWEDIAFCRPVTEETLQTGLDAAFAYAADHKRATGRAVQVVKRTEEVFEMPKSKEAGEDTDY